VAAGGLRVVEFNARFGAPETQAVRGRRATPLGGLLRATAAGDLADAGPLRWAPGAAVSVVIAAEGYPDAPTRGDEIDGLDEADRVPGGYVLHAGTAQAGPGRLVSGGGRVLNAVGTGRDLAQARAVAYRVASKIRMRGAGDAKDIGERPAAAGPCPPARTTRSWQTAARRRTRPDRGPMLALGGRPPGKLRELMSRRCG